MIQTRHDHSTGILYTIGHSNHPWEKFSEMLKGVGITLVADVRSHPASRFAPHFNKKHLEKMLPLDNIGYLFLGRELGGRPDDPHLYKNNRLCLHLLSESLFFKHGLSRLLRSMEHDRVAIMCAEKEPLHCHRTLLIVRSLKGKNITVMHILSDGSLEPHDRSESRLLKSLKKGAEGQVELFARINDPEATLEKAYEKQWERITSRKK